jgi:hypothetical protein
MPLFLYAFVYDISSCNIFYERYLICFRCWLYSVYNLNYTPTTLGAQSWRKITSEGTRTKIVKCNWYKKLDGPHNRPERHRDVRNYWPYRKSNSDPCGVHPVDSRCSDCGFEPRNACGSVVLSVRVTFVNNWTQALLASLAAHLLPRSHVTLCACILIRPYRPDWMTCNGRVRDEWYVL